ncbi:MAG: protein-methionine-sulfoxide reductase heme-binding subunit MsrQ [Pseudomonadales bacterium]
MTSIAWIKAALWLLLASPLLWLSYLISIDLRAPTTALGADPGEAVVHYLGAWALRMLLISFSVTPLYKLTRQTWLARSRRLLGLWAFAYVVLHLTSYLYFYLQFDLAALLEDVVERAYITAGMLAALLLSLMAATSTRGWRLRLGKRWQQLHRAIYPAIAAAIVHFLWFTRDQFGEVVLYAAWFTLLIGIRLYFRRQTDSRRARTA